MTCIVATKGLVAGDSAVDSGNGSVAIQKIVRIRGCLWGFAGSTTDALKFLRWVRGGQRSSTRPTFEGEGSAFDALQVTDKGIVLWDQDLEPMHMAAEYHAIGSGGDFALGALDAIHSAAPSFDSGAVHRALCIAAARDGATRPPFHFISLAGDSWTEPNDAAR